MKYNKALIQESWAQFPQCEVHVGEIKRKSQLPHWDKCKKNAVHVGIIRRQRGDRVMVVRHKIYSELDMRIDFEDLTPTELFRFGFLPNGTQTCNSCGEFSTRINMDGRCQDCNEKNEVEATTS